MKSSTVWFRLNSTPRPGPDAREPAGITGMARTPAMGRHSGRWTWSRIRTFNAIWEHARPRCEEFAGTSLRVRRQYANGHTYGLGGRPHQDDGEFTLLYYPNPEWKDGWDGETVFYRPVRRDLFARCGRVPIVCFFRRRNAACRTRAQPGLSGVARDRSLQVGARFSPRLRKLVTIDGARCRLETGRPLPEKSKLRKSPRKPARIFTRFAFPPTLVDQAVEGNDWRNSRPPSASPGFRPGNIPAKVLHNRYGAQARDRYPEPLSRGSSGARSCPKEPSHPTVGIEARRRIRRCRGATSPPSISRIFPASILQRSLWSA